MKDGAKGSLRKRVHVKSLLTILLLAGLLLALPACQNAVKSGGSSKGTQNTKSTTPVVRDSGMLAQHPLLGWSSWSSLGSSVTAAKIEAQARTLAGKLESHGYVYVNLDDYWYVNPGTTVDQYGRWVADPKKFPEGIDGLSRYVHQLGLKFGLYVNPGIPVAAVTRNTPIEGTTYHARDIADTGRYETNFSFGNKTQYFIDYHKAGAQAYVNSWASLLVQWNVDFLKLDGIDAAGIPESQSNANIQAWSRALRQSGRPIYLLLSGGFPLIQAKLLRQNANGWRIDNDIECYAACPGLVSWQNVSTRFKDVPAWLQWAGPGGWNDLDSLDVGNGARDGLTDNERQSYMTLWAISAAPLYTGDDLTTLDAYGLRLLTNDEVLAIDQQGVPGRPIVVTAQQQVWCTGEADGSAIVALFNLAASPASVTVRWSELGLYGAASVRDVWSHSNLGTFSGSFNAQLDVHASRLLHITPANRSLSHLCIKH